MIALATQLTKAPMNYQVIFNKMKMDLITVRRDEVFSDEMDALQKILIYWNGLVSTAQHWRKIAEKELINFMEKKRIRLFLKNKLIEECTKVITQISKLKGIGDRFFFKKQELLDELHDRMIYIKKSF
jgi:hypothetical protein